MTTIILGTFTIHGNDEVLAVKCVTNDPSAGKQLMDELMMLARLEHRNVVKLKGFCNNDGWFPFGRSGRGLYVCNEFFSHGSLDEHIFGMSASISCYALLMYLSHFHI